MEGEARVHRGTLADKPLQWMLGRVHLLLRQGAPRRLPQDSRGASSSSREVGSPKRLARSTYLRFYSGEGDRSEAAARLLDRARDHFVAASADVGALLETVRGFEISQGSLGVGEPQEHHGDGRIGGPCETFPLLAGPLQQRDRLGRLPQPRISEVDVREVVETDGETPGARGVPLGLGERLAQALLGAFPVGGVREGTAPLNVVGPGGTSRASGRDDRERDPDREQPQVGRQLRRVGPGADRRYRGDAFR